MPIPTAACRSSIRHATSSAATSGIQPTRVIFPTEIFRLQSSSIKNISMNGNVRYTNANMNLPNYYEQFQGLYGANRSIAYAGYANAKREVMAVDYGIVWQLAKTSASKTRSVTPTLISRESQGSRPGPP